MKKLSPTQVKSYLHCKRRWGFEYGDKKRSPPSKYAQFGIDGHKHLERWFKEGTPPNQQTPEGAVALSGLHHWPAPDLVTGVEIAIETETAVSKYYGYQDLDFFDSANGLWVVGDHKFTGSFDYALDADKLRVDVQANIYADASMKRHRVDRVELRWVYYRRVGAAKSKKVTAKDGKSPVVVFQDEVRDVFDKVIDPAAAEIHELSAIAESRRSLDLFGNSLPANPAACDDFGGCPHIGYCTVTPLERMRVVMANETLKDKLLSGRGINPPESQVPAPSAPIIAASAPAPASAMAALEKLKAAAAARSAQPAAPAVAPAPVPTNGAAVNPLLAKLQGAKPAAPALAPTQPEAPEAPAAPAAAPAAAAPTGNPLLDKLRAKAPAVEPAAPAPAPAQPAPSAAPAPSGNPLLDKLRAKTPDAPNPHLEKLVESMVAPASASAAPAPSIEISESRVFTLLINCRQVRPAVHAVLASDLIEEANRIVCDELNVADYALVDYGKGRGALLVATKHVLAGRLASGALSPGDTIALYTSNRAESDAVEAFMAFADRVLRS